MNLWQIQMKMKKFSEQNPNTLMKLNKNQILSLHPMNKGGRYSDNEIKFTTEELIKLSDEIIKTSMENSKKENL